MNYMAVMEWNASKLSQLPCMGCCTKVENRWAN